jgi:hypothetical protein
LECAQIVGDVWIFRRERFDIADFNIDFLYAGPFCAPTEEPAPLSDHARSVESIPGDQKLHALARAEFRADYNVLACAVFVQHKHFNGITEVTMIKLIIANAMESHWRVRRDHEIQCRACGSTIEKWRWEPTWRNSLAADVCDAHETARGMRLKFEQRSNFLGS